MTSKVDLDRIARDYHVNANVPDKHIEDLCQDYCAEWILRSVGTARNVLELGYGEGIITCALLADAGRRLTVVEGSAILMEKARAATEGRVITVHSLFEDYSPAQPFDAIIASHVLEHVESPTSLLAKMRTWLVPGGRLIVIVPNKESLHRRLAVLMGLQPELDTLSPRDHAVGHRRVYSHATLARDLRDGGFRVIETTGFFLKPLSNSMMLGFSRELLMAMNRISPEMPKELLANIGVVAQ